MLEDPSPLRRIYFGTVNLHPSVLALRTRLDQALLAVCLSLPNPLSADAEAMLKGEGGLSFFHRYYSPLWSWIHWAGCDEAAQEIEAGQAMAMFLHLFDDHLLDGHLPCDALRLQLRTAAWQRFESAAHRICDGKAELWQHFEQDVARYYAAIYRPPEVSDLDGYCARFREQMTTCVTIATLAMRRLDKPENDAALREILFGLGVAWRLLDDVQDAHADLYAGEKSVLYLLLDPAGQEAWRSAKEAGPREAQKWAQLVELFVRSGLLGRVLSRCAAELERAAANALAAQWPGLAAELRTLRQPIFELVSRLP